MSVRRIALATAAIGAAVAAVVLATWSHGPRATAAPLDTPTWRDVAPIFAEKCAGCHRAGGIAPFALTSGRSAAARARAILRVTQSGAMPPWMPGADSPEYVGQSIRRLTAAE
ncbi:MAG TPA: cytochrome c, partial [Gaiellaceae bacterium]|nr:cytochrome c [Gaiellaceae bacterium]